MARVFMVLWGFYSGFLWALPDMQEVEDFIQHYDLEHREKTHTPGWSFAYVQGRQKAVYSFGQRDLEKAEPVQGDTLYRIASVSKVFVAVAVQQLLEQGNVSLHTDITEYLPNLVPLKAVPYPITLHQLMTHTVGLEDKFYGDSAREQAGVETLKAHLETAFPTQLFKPSELIRYSNYGFALAALVVESVTGIPFHDYVKQHILNPTGMSDSSFILEENQRQQLASGYRYRGGEYQRRPYTWVHRYPATSMLTSANDMAKFIAMLLAGGQGEAGKVLSPASVRHMFATQFSHDPDLPGMSLGWMELHRYGNRALFHDGGTPGFAAELVMLPEHNAGYFIAANQKQSRLPGQLRFGFLKQFFARTESQAWQEIIPAMPLAWYAGQYQNTRRNHTTFESFAVLMGDEVAISVSKDGRRLVHWEREYTPYGEHKFVHSESGHKLVFKVKGERVTHLALDWGGSPRAYLKLSWWQQKNSQFALIIALLLLSIMVLAGAVIQHRKSQSGYLFMMMAYASLLSFLAGLTWYFVTLDTLLIRLAELNELKLLLCLPPLAILFAVAQLYHGPRTAKVAVALLPLFGAVLWLHQYHLVGWWF